MKVLERTLNRTDLAKGAIGQIWQSNLDKSKWCLVAITEDCSHVTLRNEVGLERQMLLTELAQCYNRVGKVALIVALRTSRGNIDPRSSVTEWVGYAA